MSTAAVTAPSSHRWSARHLWHRLERLLVGLGMSIVAWPLERIVLRSSRKD